MNAAIGYGQTAWEPERVEAPEVPKSLIGYLRGNPAFVREAIENDDSFSVKCAAAYMDGASTDYDDAVAQAIDTWIAHVWQRHDYDAGLIFRMWRELAQEAA